MSDNDLIRLAGMYENESAAGHRYFVGLMNSSVKLVMLRNSHKEAENQHDWVLYLTSRNGKKPADTGLHGESPATTSSPTAEDTPRRRRSRASRPDKKKLAAEVQAPFDDDLPADLA